MLCACTMNRGEDVLQFPIIHRQRLFRVKMEALQAQGELPHPPDLIAQHVLSAQHALKFLQAWLPCDTLLTPGHLKLQVICCAGLIDAGILSVASLAAAGLAQGLFGAGMEFPGVCAVAAALLSGALTAFCMRMGAHSIPCDLNLQ